MNSKRLIIALAAVAALALAIPAFANAVKVPTFYYYAGKCNKAKVCQQTSYTNSAGTSLVSFSLNPVCSKSSSVFAVSILKPVKVNSRHKFSFSVVINNYDEGDTNQSGATITVKGKLSKKNKMSGKWSIDNKLSAGCANLKTGKFNMKYSGAVHGG